MHAAEIQSSPTTKSHQNCPNALRRVMPALRLPAGGARRRRRRRSPRRRPARRAAPDPIPGQSAPAPSVDQKIPNVVSMIPDGELDRVFGHARKRRTQRDSDGDDEHERCGRTERRERDASLGAPERQDDERHLEPLEEHALERQREAVRVDAVAYASGLRSRLVELLSEDRVLVVQRLVPARAQDRLAQPLQPERRGAARPRRAAGRSVGST